MWLSFKFLIARVIDFIFGRPAEQPALQEPETVFVEEPTEPEQLLLPGWIAQNFHEDEFFCPDGTVVPEDCFPQLSALAGNLQALRDHLGVPVIVVSGYRNEQYNTSIGGDKDSCHHTAAAADISVPDYSVDDLAQIIDILIKDGRTVEGGVGIYPEYVHYDIRGERVRWDARG